MDGGWGLSSLWVQDSRHWPCSGNHTNCTLHVRQLVVQLPSLLAHPQVALLHIVTVFADLGQSKAQPGRQLASPLKRILHPGIPTLSYEVRAIRWRMYRKLRKHVAVLATQAAQLFLSKIQLDKLTESLHAIHPCSLKRSCQGLG